METLISRMEKNFQVSLWNSFYSYWKVWNNSFFHIWGNDIFWGGGQSIFLKNLRPEGLKYKA